MLFLDQKKPTAVKFLQYEGDAKIIFAFIFPSYIRSSGDYCCIVK